MIMVYISFNNSIGLMIVVGHFFAIFLLFEYFIHFPLVDKNISDIYGWLILVFEIFVTEILIREYTIYITD